MTTFHFYKGFKGSISFSNLDRRYHGKVEGINDCILFEGITKIACIHDFHNAVDDYLEFELELKEGATNPHGYLGEFKTGDSMTKEEAVMHVIERYGQIDGGHHKAWVIDQVARIMKGAEIEVKEARWENGQRELRVNIHESQEYLDWVEAMKDGEDGPETYDYDEGIAP